MPSFKRIAASSKPVWSTQRIPGPGSDSQSAYLKEKEERGTEQKPTNNHKTLQTRKEPVSTTEKD